MVMSNCTKFNYCFKNQKYYEDGILLKGNGSLINQYLSDENIFVPRPIVFRCLTWFSTWYSSSSWVGKTGADNSTSTYSQPDVKRHVARSFGSRNAVRCRRRTAAVNLTFMRHSRKHERRKQIEKNGEVPERELFENGYSKRTPPVTEVGRAAVPNFGPTIGRPPRLRQGAPADS